MDGTQAGRPLDPKQPIALHLRQQAVDRYTYAHRRRNALHWSERHVHRERTELPGAR
jgi:hypothetical protein